MRLLFLVLEHLGAKPSQSLWQVRVTMDACSISGRSGLHTSLWGSRLSLTAVKRSWLVGEGRDHIAGSAVARPRAGVAAPGAGAAYPALSVCEPGGNNGHWRGAVFLRSAGGGQPRLADAETAVHRTGLYQRHLYHRLGHDPRRRSCSSTNSTPLAAAKTIPSMVNGGAASSTCCLRSWTARGP